MKQFLSSKHLMVGLLFLFALSTGCRDKKVVTDSFFQPYSKTSAIYTLSLFSTVNDGMTGNLASLQAHLDTSVAAILQNDTIVSLVGKWEAVWGPVSYTNDTNSTPNACVSDNVMVLLKGLDPADPTKSMYVIAIAGTNPISTFDWMEEDFNADSLVQWPATSNLPNISAFNNPVIATDPAITNAGNYVSEGTATGLNILLNVMKDVSGNTLFQYLKDSVGNSNASLELATTGHSLAGALAPCMALVLKNNQPYWNPSGSISISSYATAGPSPGNSGFAQYFQSQMGSNFFGAYNSLDVIPHGFQYSMMEQVGGLYDSCE